MIPTESLRGSRRLRSIVSIYPTGNLRGAVFVAVVLFLLGSLTHGVSFFSYRSLGALEYKAVPAKNTKLILQDLASQSITTVSAPQSNTNTPEPSSELVQGALRATTSVSKGTALVPPLTIAATNSQSPTDQRSPANSSSNAQKPATLKLDTGVTDGGSKETQTTQKPLELLVTTGAVPLKQADSTKAQQTPKAEDDIEKELCSTHDDSGRLAEITFSLNHVRSTCNCGNSEMPDAARFCKFLKSTIGSVSSYSELSKMDLWSKVAQPHTLILLILTAIPYVLLITAVVILSAPLMSLTGYTKRFIGSTLFDLASAAAGTAIGWQRYLSITMTNSVHDVLAQSEWSSLVADVVKEREPTLVIICLAGAFWLFSAGVIALEWILHAREAAQETDEPNPATRGSVNAENSNEELSLLLAPPN